MTYRAELKRSLISGIVLATPLIVTIVVFNFVFQWLTGLINPLIVASGLVELTANIELIAQLVAVGILLLVLTAVGYVAQHGIGQRVFGRMGRVMDLVPLVSVVYGGVRQVASALVHRRSRYEDVALVEYPREDIYRIGFVTGDAPDEAAKAAADEPVMSVYVPGSPNPTQGVRLFVPESELLESDLSVRAAIRTIVTTGMGDEAENGSIHDGAAIGSAGELAKER